MARKYTYDYLIVVVVALLVATGIIMVFSSSFSYALVVMNDGYFFLKRILIWALLGCFAMYFSAKIDYWKWAKYANILCVLSIALLILVLTPVGIEINGARRWIGVGAITFMPSEIAKFAVIIFVSTSVVRKKEKIESLIYGLLPYLLFIGLFFGLIYLQPGFVPLS